MSHKEYRHVSWFSEEYLKDKKIHRMCKFCGNSNPKIMECHNCDIGFENYILIDVD